MTQRGSFTTSITWNDGEDEAKVRVLYVGRAGSPQTMTDPEDPASIEIISINPVDPAITLPAEWTDGDRDEELYDECFEDWDAEAENASEWRAQSRRDQLMGGF